MQAIKFLLISSFAFLVSYGAGFAQNITVTTANTAAWSTDQTSGFNLTAAAAQTAIGGLGFGTAPVAYAGTCGNVNATPAAQMTYPGGTNCGSGNYMTRYYSTSVNITGCETATFQVRADDAFRVFLNGTQVTNGTSYSLSGCSGYTLNGLSGNAWGSTYTFNIPVTSFVVGQNTVVIEVANCSGVSYLAASLAFQSAPALPSTNQIHYSASANPPTGYNVGLWGVNPKTMKTSGYDGMWTGNWLIQSGPSATGPWSTFDTNTESSSTAITPWYPATFSYGTYYKVTYTITTTCGYTATYTQVIFICTGCLAPAGPSGDFVDNTHETAELAQKPNLGTVQVLDMRSFSNYQDTLSGAYVDIVTTAYVDNLAKTLVIATNEGQDDAQVDVLSIDGRRMWTKKSPQTNVRIDISGWQEGIYIVYTRNKGIVGVPRKVVVLRE